MARFNSTTTADEAASLLSQQIKTKTILITGVSPKSLGAEAAKAMAPHGPALLILASRNLARVLAVVTDIQAVSPEVHTRSLLLDLASQKSVRKAAAEVLSYQENINVVINNGGIMACPYSTTPEGVESQFGTNHIGHFLFTNLIMPKIVAAGPGSRIVNVSSRGHRYSPVRFDDINFSDGNDYEKFTAYGQSKTANILYSVSLADKLKSKRIYSFSLHPGMIPYTNLMQYMGAPEGAQLEVLNPDGTVKPSAVSKTLLQGAATEIIAAFDPELVDHNGCYLFEGSPDAPLEWPVKPYAVDKENAEKLWTLSEKLVGQRFEF